MSDLEKLLTKLLIESLSGSDHHHHPDGQCPSCCDCTTERTMEGTAARFNEQAAFNSAESQRSFVQQQNAQFAQLLKLQADITNKPVT